MSDSVTITTDTFNRLTAYIGSLNDYLTNANEALETVRSDLENGEKVDQRDDQQIITDYLKKGMCADDVLDAIDCGSYYLDAEELIRGLRDRDLVSDDRIEDLKWGFLDDLSAIETSVDSLRTLSVEDLIRAIDDLGLEVERLRDSISEI